MRVSWCCLCGCKEHKSLALRKEGSGIVLDSQLPYLFCIDDNVLRTGLVLYHLKVIDSVSIHIIIVIIMVASVTLHHCTTKYAATLQLPRSPVGQLDSPLSRSSHLLGGRTTNVSTCGQEFD